MSKTSPIISMIVWNEFLNDARVLKEAQTLQAVGYSVIVHALHTPGKTQERETLPGGIKVVRVARSPFWRFRKRKKLMMKNNFSVHEKLPSMSPTKQMLRLLARFSTHVGLLCRLIASRADVIHAHDVNVLPTAWLASCFLRVPLIYDAHEISTDREGYKSFRHVVGWVEKKIMPRTIGSITTTDARAKFFARAYGVTRPLVLQNRPRQHHIERSTRIRDELNLSEPLPIVLYQGGLQQGRGLALLVEAAAEVKNAYFVFIGGGRLSSSLKMQAESLGITDRVFFIPTVALNDLPAYTLSADIGVQPIENTCLNHFTTDSNKLFEYVLAGLPVIASKVPEIKKVVEGYGLGILFPPGDKLALVDALNNLITDSAARLCYTKNACKAASSLNWEAQEHGLIELYKKIFVSIKK